MMDKLLLDVSKLFRYPTIRCRTRIIDFQNQLEACLVIDVVNNGLRPITIIEAGFRISDGAYIRKDPLYNHLWIFPKKIEDSDLASFPIRINQIAALINTEDTHLCYAYILDSNHKIYKTKSVADLIGYFNISKQINITSLIFRA
jgi:hypothetical protein